MKNFYKLTSKIMLFAASLLFSVVFSQTFTQKTSGTTFIIYDMCTSPTNSNILYGVTSQYTQKSKGEVIKSTDAGETWTTKYSISNNSFSNVAFVSDTKGFIAGFGIFQKTSDGGTTWQDVTLPQATNTFDSFIGLEFYDANVGVVFGHLISNGNYVGFQTTDGGTTWTTTNSTSAFANFDVTYAAANTLYSVGGDQKLAKSTDGGNNWTQMSAGIFQSMYFRTEFKDANNGFITSEDGTIFRTTNGGTSLSQVFTTFYHNFYGTYYKGNVMMVAGTDEDIYISSDNGTTWSMLFNGTGSRTMYSINQIDASTIIVAGSGGTIYKGTNLTLATSESQKNEQSYKNWYNNADSSYNILAVGNSISNYKIYSADGKLIEQKKHNNALLTIDLNSFSAGMYIITINTKNNLTETFKFLKN